MAASATGVVRCPNCGTRNRIPAGASGTPQCGKCHQALPWIVDAGDADFGDVAERSRLPVLVDLWAPWCGPCRMVSPVVEQLAAEHSGRLKVVKVNVDEAPGVSERFGVRGIPTLLFLRNGTVGDRQVGAPPPGMLREWLDRNLAKHG